MVSKTFIDESGNTGDNLLDKNQQFFTLAAVSIPSSKLSEIEDIVNVEFSNVKEKDEKEIKTTKWLKSSVKRDALRNILMRMKDAECDFSAVFIEKRFMIAALCVEEFLDGAYNDNEDYTWCNSKEEKKVAAQYFYNILVEDDCEVIAPAFSKPSLEDVHKVINRLMDKTLDERYLSMLKGCHVENLYRDELNVYNNIQRGSCKQVHSPNYVAFSALGMEVVEYCRQKGYQTEIIFDNCFQINDAYKYIFELFENMKNDSFVEAYLGIYSWKSYVTGFKIEDSKKSFLLQTADIIATSVLKTLEKVFTNKQLNTYDNFIISFIHEKDMKNSINLIMDKKLWDKYLKI